MRLREAEQMKILVSRCLLGEKCRYDGKLVPDESVIALGKEHRLVPVCPEMLGGLPCPRTPCERQADGSVLSKDGMDHTESYRSGAREALRVCLEEGCELAVLKARSPSCGKGLIYDGTFTGTLKEGNGVTAELLMQNGIPVENR